jgi:hypothetical protein
MDLHLDTQVWPWRWSIDYPQNLMCTLFARFHDTIAIAALEFNGRENVRSWIESARETRLVGRLEFDR